MFGHGQPGSTVELVELDCATARARRTSAATTRRNGEMTGSNEPGAYETYPEGSLMVQLAVPLCEGMSGERGFGRRQPRVSGRSPYPPVTSARSG